MLPRTLTVTVLLALAGCRSVPPIVTSDPATSAAPTPPPTPPSPLAPSPPSLSEPIPQAPARAASPFIVVAPHLGPGSIFELEDGLYAAAGDDIFELAGGAVRSRFDLARGLPSDDCQSITGLVGRFPDAAFLLVSWSSRACGSIFGAHRIHRWTGRTWTPIPEPRTPAIKLAAHASLDHSQGPGVVICDHNAVGDGCGGHFALLPRVDGGTASPVGRVISTSLSQPMFRFAKSGLAVALGGGPDGVAIERWQPGASKGVVTRVPVEGCEASGIHVFEARDVVIAVSCTGDPGGRLMRFDGRAFATLPMPTRAPVVALTGAPDGTIWLATADDNESRVHRRSPKGEWASAPLPPDDPANTTSKPFRPSRLVVRGEDVWAIGAGVLHARRSEMVPSP